MMYTDLSVFRVAKYLQIFYLRFAFYMLPFLAPLRYASDQYIRLRNQQALGG